MPIDRRNLKATPAQGDELEAGPQDSKSAPGAPIYAGPESDITCPHGVSWCDGFEHRCPDCLADSEEKAYDRAVERFYQEGPPTWRDPSFGREFK